jgi:NAD(P)H-nitrite reductase large subunit
MAPRMWGGVTSAAELRAIADVQDIVHGASVTCLLHNRTINLADWRARALDEGSACIVPVRLERQRIIFAVGA